MVAETIAMLLLLSLLLLSSLSLLLLQYCDNFQHGADFFCDDQQCC